MMAPIAFAAEPSAVLDLRTRTAAMRLDDVAVRVGGADGRAAATPLRPSEARYRIRLGPFDDRRWTLVGTLNTESIVLRYRRADGVTETLRTDAAARARRMSLVLPANAYGTTVEVDVVYARRSGIPRLELGPDVGERLLAIASTQFFFVGFFAAIGLANVLLFFIFRERSSAWYAFAMIAIVALSLFNANFAPLPLGAAARALVRAGFLIAYYIGIVAFSREFLGIARRSRLLDWAITVLVALNALAIGAAVLVGDAWPLAAIDDTLLDALLAALLVAGAIAMRRAVAGASVYTAALAVLAVGIAFNQFADHDVFFAHRDVVAQYVFNIALATSTALFGLGSALRTRRHDAERRRLALLIDVDGLTGIPNRRAFDAELALAWQRALRTPQSLAVLMVDVDEFKRFNDLAGHLAGDDVLRKIAEALSTAAQRPDDLVARYGGEEFAAIVSAATVDDARIIGERMRANVRAVAVRRPDARGIVSVSIGCAACIPGPGTDPRALVAAADRALYAAKHAGRDRVALAAPLVSDAV
jgi:diguanylate cyclase (GGDEF)-like protein